MFFFNKNNIILIKRKFYIINNLTIKIFVNINIIKSENIIFDMRKSIMTIDFYRDIEIFITFFI